MDPSLNLSNVCTKLRQFQWVLPDRLFEWLLGMPGAAEPPPPATVCPELMRQMEDAVLEMVDNLWCLADVGIDGPSPVLPPPEDDPPEAEDTLDEGRGAPEVDDAAREDAAAAAAAEAVWGMRYGNRELRSPSSITSSDNRPRKPSPTLHELKAGLKY